MPRLAANVTMMFNEYPLIDRFEAAARAGFHGVECLWPYEIPLDLLKAKVDACDLSFALINTAISPQQDHHIGLAANTDRVPEFRQLMSQALNFGAGLRVGAIHVMVGESETNEQNRRAVVSNLKWAGSKAADLGINLVIEPINARDRPKWFLKSTEQALAIVQEVDLPSVKMLFDVYHVQIIEGDLTRRLQSLINWIGHVQIAGVPARNEPDIGEVNIHSVLQVLDDLGYQGWVGCEYTPLNKTDDGLAWAERYGVIAKKPGGKSSVEGGGLARS